MLKMFNIHTRNVQHVFKKGEMYLKCRKKHKFIKNQEMNTEEKKETIVIFPKRIGIVLRNLQNQQLSANPSNKFLEHTIYHHFGSPQKLWDASSRLFLCQFKAYFTHCLSILLLNRTQEWDMGQPTRLFVERSSVAIFCPLVYL